MCSGSEAEPYSQLVLYDFSSKRKKAGIGISLLLPISYHGVNETTQEGAVDEVWGCFSSSTVAEGGWWG